MCNTLKIYDLNKISFIERSSLSANLVIDKIDISNTSISRLKFLEIKEFFKFV